MNNSQSQANLEMPTIRAAAWGRIDSFPMRKVDLSSRTTVEDELLSQIEFFSRVADAFHDNVNFNNLEPSTIESIQALLRQTIAFWKSAKSLDIRSGPLLYYYSLLNFAKAAITAGMPGQLPPRIKHGITFRTDCADFRDHIVRVEGNGVFPSLYKLIFASELPHESTFRIGELLDYCTEISFESGRLGLGPNRYHPFYIRFLVEGSESSLCLSFPKTSAPILAADEKFSTAFHEVQIDKRLARDVFGILGPQHSASAFYQSERKEAINSTDGSANVGQMLRDSFSKTSPQFDRLLLPGLEHPDCLYYEKTANGYWLDELTAGFAVIFYLGSLVRYQPEILEKVLNAREGWLVERLIRQVPLACLHRLVNKLCGQALVFTTR